MNFESPEHTRARSISMMTRFVNILKQPGTVLYYLEVFREALPEADTATPVKLVAIDTGQ